MELEILQRIKETVESGSSCALVTVTDVSGSSPASNGDMMLVFADETIMGTIGGGKFEYETIIQAINCINNNENKELDFILTPEEFGMQCGGTVRVYIKVFKPKPKLVVIGGGHIGYELYKLALNLDFEIDVFDDREEFCNKERFPKANNIKVGAYEETLINYETNKNTYIVIATKGHDGDKIALKNLVGGKYKYLGMIGSRRKIKTIMTELIESGVAKEDLKKVYTPLGLDMNSNEPNEIALGILSEIVIVKNNGRAEHMRNIKKVEL